MKQFWCNHCQILFSDKGKKKEWLSKIYGFCHKWVAFCPKCKNEVDEYQPLRRSKAGNQQLSEFPCSCQG